MENNSSKLVGLKNPTIFKRTVDKTFLVDYIVVIKNKSDNLTIDYVNLLNKKINIVNYFNNYNGEYEKISYDEFKLEIL